MPVYGTPPRVFGRWVEDYLREEARVSSMVKVTSAEVPVTVISVPPGSVVVPADDFRLMDRAVDIMEQAKTYVLSLSQRVHDAYHSGYDDWTKCPLDLCINTRNHVAAWNRGQILPRQVE